MNVQLKPKSSMSPLKRLHDCGQAVWLDFLARKFIAEGSLKKLIEQDGLTGVTSNPSIFEKAIGGSADYDSAMKAATCPEVAYSIRFFTSAAYFLPASGSSWPQRPR